MVMGSYSTVLFVVLLSNVVTAAICVTSFAGFLHFNELHLYSGLIWFLRMIHSDFEGD